MKKLIILTASFVFLQMQCFGWGQKGHDTTCAIAENHLSDKSKTAINELLDGQSIVYWANWLDNASNTPEYAYTKTWHYKNIDADQTFDSAPLLPTGDVLSALYDQTAALEKAYTEGRKADAALALKIVIHIMGDVHQPMHMGHASDLGGNRWLVQYFNEERNLHNVWDTPLVESAHKWSFSEWRDLLDRLSPEQQAAITAGSFPQWAEETYEIAKKVYEDSPAGERLSYDYVRTWTPVIEQQFLRGGLRLARVLNEIFE